MNTPQNTDAKAEVLAIMREHSDTMMAGDVDTLLSYYSQDWQNNQGADKDSLKETIIAGGSRIIAHDFQGSHHLYTYAEKRSG